MPSRVLVLNGPNLNMLGQREKTIYGTRSLEEINRELKEWGQRNGLEIDFFQSNHEGDLIDRIHQAYGTADVLIVNAGALTHYSYALHDALKAVNIPFIEVHLSNIYAREEFRHHSLLSSIASGGIFGFGELSYRLALHAAADLLQKKSLS